MGRLDGKTALIAAAGGSSLALSGDVAHREDAERWVTETVRALGSLDILINSAGVTSRGAPAGWDWKRVGLGHGREPQCACPGFVQTSMTRALTEDPERLRYRDDRHPMGRLARPEEIAQAALFLASDEASFITATPLLVDGGYLAR